MLDQLRLLQEDAAVDGAQAALPRGDVIRYGLVRQQVAQRVGRRLEVLIAHVYRALMLLQLILVKKQHCVVLAPVAFPEHCCFIEHRHGCGGFLFIGFSGAASTSCDAAAVVKVAQ